MQLEASRVSKIDSTDAPRVQVVVAVLLQREGKTLLGKLKTGLWCLPEGLLEVGETLDSTAYRVMMKSCGLPVTKVSISRSVPYVNTYIEATGLHALTLVMLAEDPGGEVQVVDKQWTEWGFFSTAEAPTPLLVTVRQMIGLAKAFTEQEQLKASTAEKVPLSNKRPPQRRSKSQ
jgi:ADP-ribose pyrophosphatase YjhB (NUDIX family)